MTQNPKKAMGREVIRSKMKSQRHPFKPHVPFMPLYMPACRNLSLLMIATSMGHASLRFMPTAEQMENTLQRTSISTSIKERLDFSCAIFSADAKLVATPNKFHYT